MEGTPKLQRKSVLSLGRRLKQRQARLSCASPANSDSIVISDTPSSPSVISISSDGGIGIECTPPHKRQNIHHSPKMFDTSFSPSRLLSQTLALDSPEVGWRWGRQKDSIPTPDSAYAADNSFTSAGTNSTDTVVRTRADTQRQKLVNETKREEHLKAIEFELRRAKKSRAEELLKKRCAKLQEQLKVAAPQNTQKKSSVMVPLAKSAPIAEAHRMETRSSTTKQSTFTATQTQSPHASSAPSFKPNDTLNDFFNDSATDCLLLEATQSLESKIVELTQKTTANAPDADIISHSAPTASTPTIASNKEKRSSLYMQFLEDDSPDDWFISLDEVIRQATQSKKPRTSFQRYKSMPADTITTIAGTAGKSTTLMTTAEMTLNNNNNNYNNKNNNKSSTTEATVHKMKRHSSTHSISPPSSSYRARQLHMRK